MKQSILFFAIFLLFTQTSNSQDSLHMFNSKVPNAVGKAAAGSQYTSEYYALKSSKLKTTGWILFSIGTVLGVTGEILNESYKRKVYHLDQLGDALGDEYGAALLIIAGSSMVITSVPIFIRAGYYKRKSLDMSASFNLESSQELSQSGLSMKRYPAVGIRIQF
jgi:hypothetical protein